VTRRGVTMNNTRNNSKKWIMVKLKLESGWGWGKQCMLVNGILLEEEPHRYGNINKWGT